MPLPHQHGAVRDNVVLDLSIDPDIVYLTQNMRNYSNRFLSERPFYLGYWAFFD
jgi:hypothetical protein